MSKEVFTLPANYNIPEENKEKILGYLQKRFDEIGRNLERKNEGFNYTKTFRKKDNILDWSHPDDVFSPSDCLK